MYIQVPTSGGTKIQDQLVQTKSLSTLFVQYVVDFFPKSLLESMKLKNQFLSPNSFKSKSTI